MSRDDLVGEWVQEPGGHRARLRGDGSAVFTNALTHDVHEGTWESIDARHIRTLEQVPGEPGSSHNPNGYTDDTLWEIAEEQPNRLVLHGREGIEQEAFEYEPVVWTRESTSP